MVIINNIINITSLYSTYQPLHLTRYFDKHYVFENWFNVYTGARVECVWTTIQVKI